MATATKLSGTYVADPVHSSFAFSVRYQGVSLFKGTLDEVDAKLVDGRLEGAAKVESISIRTPEQFRAHVLSEEFFDAAYHPAITSLVEQLLSRSGLTRHGLEFVREARSTHREGVRRYFLDRLSDEDQHTLAELWTRLS